MRADRWTTHGSAKVLGSVEVGVAELHGSVAVGRELQADLLSADGVIEVTGPVEVAGRLSGRGELRAASRVRAAELEFRGSWHVPASTEVARRCVIAGRVRAGTFSAGELDLEGELAVDGPLRAQRLDLRPRDGSRIGFVEGARVRVHGPVPTILDAMLGHAPSVRVARIEAQRAEVTGVDVEFVRAPEIVLGPATHVTAFEGTLVRRHPSARTGPEARSPPPHGLRR